MRDDPRYVLAMATALSAVAMWLMLPRGAAQGRLLGAMLGAISLGLFGSLQPALGNWAAQSVFYIVSGVTLAAAAATVTFRNPVYSAIWFALSLLGTAGLFMFQGAQFLGVATIVVYAGAILVTFLFVLMLAQPEGLAFYDRISWEASLSAITGCVLVGALTLMVGGVFQPNRYLSAVEADSPPHAALVASQTAEQLATQGEQVLSPEHLATLGGQLFGRHLIAVEIAGTLLLVALVGAVAIVMQARTDRVHEGARHG